MAVPTFENGRPTRITLEYFRRRYGQNFPDLLKTANDQKLSDFIADTYVMFYGVGELWKHMPTQEFFDKTQMCYGLLVAWYVVDVAPHYSVGVMTSGGIPIKSKLLGGVKIEFHSPQQLGVKGYQDLLSGLRSNPFGNKAYQMLKSSGSLIKIYGRTKDGV